MNLELLRRGTRSLSNAFFLNDFIIPLAYKHGRWDFVVYESYRAIELWIKGLRCLIGDLPPERQAMAESVYRLQMFLQSSLNLLPFIAENYFVQGSAYCLILHEELLHMGKLNEGALTILGTTDAGDFISSGGLNYLIEVSDTEVRLSVNGKPILAATDESYPRPEGEMSAHLPWQPEEGRKDAIKQVLEQLRRERHFAGYGEREYAREEADNAVGSLRNIVDASATFFVTDEKTYLD